MTNNAHNVCLTTLINGIAHGLAVYGKALVCLSVPRVPARKCTIQMDRINTDEDITDDGLTGNNPPTLFQTAAETLPSLLTEAFGPIRNSLVAAHATQGCSCSNGKNGGKIMTSSLSTAGIRDIGKETR